MQDRRGVLELARLADDRGLAVALGLAGRDAESRDRATAELIAEVNTSADFLRLWARHDARPSRDELKRFAHPIVGELSLRRQALTIGGAEDQVIIVYQAVPSSPSAEALARLL